MTSPINKSTPHIAANKGDFAPTVLMPGDPLRSKFIAETFFENPRLVNNVRGVQGYTGTYMGNPISVMASGMGAPSMAIYSYELFNFFDVENIIRIGTIGALQPGINLRDIIIAMGASTDSAYIEQFDLHGSFSPMADFTLLKTAVGICEKEKVNYHVGSVFSSDIFYNDESVNMNGWKKLGILGTEMEAAALYTNATVAKKRALAIMTVSDQLITGEAVSSDERQNAFTDMMRIALETAVAIQKNQ